MNISNAIILDTETHDLPGLVIQFAYAYMSFQPHEGKLTPVMQHQTLFNELYSIGDQQINPAAMAVHNIIDSDLTGKPHTSTITVPLTEGYIIGHNIDFDINALELSTGVKCNLKPICTLALARAAWPDLPSHKLTALIYHIYGPTEFARNLVQNSHDAAADIRNTAHLLSALCAHLRIQSIEALYEASVQARIPKKMAFGKHKGSLIEDVPRQYMNWFINKSENPDPYLVAAFRQQISIWDAQKKKNNRHDAYKVGG